MSRSVSAVSLRNCNGIAAQFQRNPCSISPVWLRNLSGVRSSYNYGKGANGNERAVEKTCRLVYSYGEKHAGMKSIRGSFEGKVPEELKKHETERKN